jgi:hypothetical protein
MGQLSNQLPAYVSHVLLLVKLEDWEINILNNLFQDIIKNK